MIKKDEVAEPTSCLSRADADEPIFVLRAHDILAPIVVKYWALLAQDAGVPVKKVQLAWEIANDMRAWPDRKLPD